jgi:hypothetical protein
MYIPSIIFIIIGKQLFLSHSLPPKNSARLLRIRPSGFHVFGFRNNNSFYGARSSALRPIPNLEDQVPLFMPPSDSVAQL